MNDIFNEELESIQQRLQKLIEGSPEGWTYVIFWEPSDCSSVLEWGDGYYEGEGDKGKAKMKTSSAAEQKHRKKVLRELTSLIYGSTSTPDDYLDEDITDTEWLILISMTRLFYRNEGGSGLPGQAYFSKIPIWVNGAKRLANSGWERASQGQVFGLQTFVCIPLANGVVELGSTEIIFQSSDLMHKLGSLWKEEDNSSCSTFWTRLFITCDSSLFVSDVKIDRKIKESIVVREQNEKKQRKLKSKVWDEFTKSKGEDGEQLAICNHCGGEFDGSSKNGTTHLKNHLESMKCQAKRKREDGHADESTKTRDLATPFVIKGKSFVLTMEESIVVGEQINKKRRKLKSKVWDEFTKSKGEDGKQWAICNRCGGQFDGSSKKGTTHLKNHLESKKCQFKIKFGSIEGVDL